MNKHGANSIDGLTIGNEVADTPMNIMQEVWDVRGYLHNDVKYKGPVSTVHSWVHVMNNPVLCDADRVTVNAHAFYDGNFQAWATSSFIKDVVLPNIKKAGAKYPAVNDIIIAESGWPSRGPSNKVAVSSLANEQAALSGLNCAANSSKIIAFEATDSPRKGGSANEKSECSSADLAVGCR